MTQPCGNCAALRAALVAVRSQFHNLPRSGTADRAVELIDAALASSAGREAAERMARLEAVARSAAQQNHAASCVGELEGENGGACDCFVSATRAALAPAPAGGPAAEVIEDDGLTAVAGDRLPTSIDAFTRRCRFLIREQLMRPAPDNGIVGVLADAVRLAREHVDSMRLAPADGPGEKP